MKSIDPINPDTKPENDVAQSPQSVATTPINTSVTPDAEPVSSTAPAQTGNNMPATSQTSSPEPVVPEKQSRPTTDSLYPTPMTSAERNEIHSKAYEDNGKTGLSISQLGIPFIIGGFSLISLLMSIPSLANAAKFSSVGALPSMWKSAMWLIIVLVIVQLIITIVVCYNIFRGSKVALALLTGPLAIYLQYMMFAHVLQISQSGFSSRPSAMGFMVVNLVLAILLVLAWTRERKFYL